MTYKEAVAMWDGLAEQRDALSREVTTLGGLICSVIHHPHKGKGEKCQFCGRGRSFHKTTNETCRAIYHPEPQPEKP